MYCIYWTLQKFWKVRNDTEILNCIQKWLLPLNINTTILKYKVLSSITWTDPSLPICYDLSETLKFRMDYNFFCGILYGDSHSKHILIILVINSWNFRKLQEWFSEFEWDEDRTQNRKSNNYWLKRWNFSRMSILKSQNSISREYYILNNAVLFLECKLAWNPSPIVQVFGKD